LTPEDVVSAVGELVRGLSTAETQPGLGQLLDGTSESEWNESIKNRILGVLDDYKAAAPTQALSITKTAYELGKLSVRNSVDGRGGSGRLRLNSGNDADGFDRDRGYS